MESFASRPEEAMFRVMDTDFVLEESLQTVGFDEVWQRDELSLLNLKRIWISKLMGSVRYVETKLFGLAEYSWFSTDVGRQK